jgi:RNA polymerase sigma factor (sigma-70 family)
LGHPHEIIGLIAQGDRNAFQQLYGQFAEKVYNTALSYVQDQQAAEEVTQDVFMTVFRNAMKFRGDAALGTWIYRITVNTSLNFIKKKRRFSFLQLGHEDKDQPDFEHPGIEMEKQEHAKMLFWAIDTLPAQQKTAFILSFVEELPRQEVADIMEISLKAAESLLQRAKKNLRDKLGDYFQDRRKNKN